MAENPWNATSVERPPEIQNAQEDDPRSFLRRPPQGEHPDKTTCLESALSAVNYTWRSVSVMPAPAATMPPTPATTMP
ncbi:MAG: hypothetical protein WBW41_15505, partial [Verrucomicrobiia bacterium]